ncbi:DUF721 domain-containing protein [Candidatus Margulisiibacteriota bacterium]
MATHIGKILEVNAKNAPAISRVLDEVRVFSAWEKAVSGKIAANSSPEKFVAGTLYLKAKSSTWAQELSLIKETLLEKMNSVLGQEVIRDMKFKTGTILGQPKEKENLSLTKNKTCAKCGIEFAGQGGVCRYCEKELKEKTTGEIYQLLGKSPWLKHGELGEAGKKIGQEKISKIKKTMKSNLLEKLIKGSRDMKKKDWEITLRSYAEVLLGREKNKIEEKDLKGVRQAVRNKVNNYSRRRKLR